METSQPLSIESFSYSWLANLKPSAESPGNSFRDSLDASDEASFIEIDPKLYSSRRLFKVSQDFDFPVSQTPLTLLHADELISNGFLVPIFVKQMEAEAFGEFGSSESTPSSPISICATQKLHPGKRFRSSSLRRCRMLSKRIFEKYLDFVRPLCQRVRGRRSGSRVGTSDPGSQEPRNWECSSATSPRASVAYSADNWRRSCDSDSSIYDAVLHCKRTIGMLITFIFLRWTC